MNKYITLGGKDIEFKASAVTSILYKRTFGQDLTTIFSEYVKNYKEVKKINEQYAIEDGDSDEVIAEKRAAISSDPIILQFSMMSMELFPKIAYIMYLEANVEQRELFRKLNEDDFIMWLGQFEKNEIQEHTVDFMNLWNGNAKTSVKPKN